jgi:hypothetical protein
MKTFLTAAMATCFAAASFAAPAMADSLTIKVKPNSPVVKKVVVREPCYYKTVKKVTNNKTVVTKTRVCP